MITKEIIGQNDHLYDALFADISENVTDSNEEKIVVNTLEDYFMNLRTIVDWVGNGHLDKTYYLRLPADEELFEINANTRKISVPSNYKNYGIAVVGDTFAETLWFRIDRYYDLQDLSLTDIKIYWELPRELPDTKKLGYSTPVFVDINSEARQLIFGWVIPEALTKSAGELKFAVSFSKKNGEGQDASVEYEFNTLIQSVKINKTLSHNEPVVDATDFNSVSNRLQSTTDIGKIFVSRPIFVPFGGYLVTNYDNISKKIISTSETIGEDQLISIVRDEDGDIDTTNSKLPLLIFSAYSDTNGANISYNAFRCKSESNRGEADVISNAGIYYYETKDGETKNPNKIYYDSNFAEVTGSFIEGETYYEAYQGYTIKAPGTYQAKATATVNDTASSSEYSGVWTWEYPNEFIDGEITVKNKEGIIGKAGIELEYTKLTGQQGKANYSFVYFKKEDAGNETVLEPNNENKVYFLPDEAGTYTIKATKKLNGAETKEPYIIEDIVFQNAATPVTISLANDAATFIGIGEKAKLVIGNYNTTDHNYIFQWQRKKDSTWEDISTLRFENPVLSEDGDYEQIISNAGVYRLVVKANYLKDSIQTTADEIQFTVWTIE